MFTRRGMQRAAFLGSLFASVAAFGCNDDERGAAGGAGGAPGAAGEAGGGVAPVDVSPDAVQARLRVTLNELAAMGPKRAGSPAGQAAGDYVKRRFEAAGARDVSTETFSFSRFQLDASSLAVTIDGAAVPMAHDVFAYSGTGRVEADVVDVGRGRPEDYAGKDVTGKIVFVVRDPGFHRQAQYGEALARGASGLLYASSSPDNLIQVGTVTDAAAGLAKMPTLTVGKEDGAKIKQALAEGKPTRAALDVTASLQPAQGRNIIARLPGSEPSGAYLMVGAHYDTWHIGSSDNGTGVAALLELGERLAAQTDRRLGIMLVGFDAEELGLFGGYDFLRRHVVAANEPMLAFVNLEMPAGTPTGFLRGVASTNDGPIAPAGEASLSSVYPLFVGMEFVPEQFGGLVPTDIQGMYWYGMQGMTTYCDTEYYHTSQDTPDKVDVDFLAKGTLALFDTLVTLDGEPAQSFAARDALLWDPAVATSSAADGSLDVTVTARDSAGKPQPNARVRVWVDVDDFTRSFEALLVADAAGVATVRVPAPALAQGQGGRWMHVTAGKTYPLAERLKQLP
ncbi:MAG TPA: M28 family peptidase [Polyangiaceae bacterium]|nr:M28 family peptidase [Polyangiaceae bacterium]